MPLVERSLYFLRISWWWGTQIVLQLQLRTHQTTCTRANTYLEVVVSAYINSYIIRKCICNSGEVSEVDLWFKCRLRSWWSQGPLLMSPLTFSVIWGQSHSFWTSVVSQSKWFFQGSNEYTYVKETYKWYSPISFSASPHSSSSFFFF